ncbi:MAG: 3-oxoacid CoA-transferase subunit B [Candidatus Gastranaerophilales bacterium]|nr:3-oxoacid CoA-transferase subunit B [Candidatus Gastranaerophilales bacterium]
MPLLLETVLSREKVREIIARRVAKEFNDGDVVTLGIGLPNEVAAHIPSGINVVIHSENGVLGLGKKAEGAYFDKRVTNSGGTPSMIKPGASFFDTETALMMMRGGHIDATVLGALQVDEEGNIASWMIPDKFIPGIGGSMDLVVGAKRVIVAMEHLSKGEIKIVKKCTLPLTACHEVDMIVTERSVFEYINGKMFLTEINPMYSIDDIRASVFADFAVSSDLKTMEI